MNNIVSKQNQAPGVEDQPLTVAENMPVNQADRLIELAITSNVDADRLDKLLALKERYEKEEARKVYTQAMANFKAEGITITKDKTVRFPHKDGPGETSYSHASLGNIVAIAVPALARQGLSHRWEAKREDDRIMVRCIMTHAAGHSEATEWWPGPLDSSGKKNPIQQAASTVTYLERYTFLMITGLAVEDQDDDGAASGEPPESVKLISEDQVNTLHSKITGAELDMDATLRWLSTSAAKAGRLEDIPVNMFDIVNKKIDAAVKAKDAQ